MLGFLRSPPPRRGGTSCQTCEHPQVDDIDAACRAFAAAKARADDENEPGHKRSWPHFLDEVIKGRPRRRIRKDEAQPRGIAPSYKFKAQAFMRHVRGCLDIDA